MEQTTASAPAQDAPTFALPRMVAEALAPGAGAQVRIGMPSGILTVGAEVGQESNGQWVAHSGAFYRTARRLFDGRVYAPMPRMR